MKGAHYHVSLTDDNRCGLFALHQDCPGPRLLVSEW